MVKPKHHGKPTYHSPPSLSSSRQEPTSDMGEPSPSYDSSYSHEDRDTRTPSSSIYSPADSLSATSSILSSSSTALSAYVAIAPLPVFHGAPDECPVSHLARFMRVCRANNVATADAAARIFPVTLDGEASLWYELSVEPDPSLTWDEVRSMFMEAYRRPDRSREELMTLRQGDDERVRSFYLRLQWILKRCPELRVPEEMLKGIFVDGLREEFQECVALRRPESLDDAFHAALAWEVVRGRRVEGECGRCGFCGGRHAEKGCEVRRRMREMWVRLKEEGVLGRSTSSLVESRGTKMNSQLNPQSQSQCLSQSQSQCGCWKHQCWKRLERSASVAVDRSAPNASSNAANAG